MNLMEVGVDPYQLGLEFGGGLFIGMFAGIAAKKLIELVAVIIGIVVALFKFLESREVIAVDWEQLTAGILELGGPSSGSPTWVMTILSTLSISAGFVGGFFIGFRIT
ncbi:FUN14 domain-containing protein (plasmid) [Halorarum halophilum]|uniref:FUN14 domain-containing protein n=1 Tax=Halorarum halophilum TaxID=2743090 RepID=A0A7D5H3R0_9EURY|nr:FUN14 domain-containing protein [Halobaculum halophilum]QLG29853.1 FUN14 domain-containing protein [Halobaculum halophilum]